MALIVDGKMVNAEPKTGRPPEESPADLPVPAAWHPNRAANEALAALGRAAVEERKAAKARYDRTCTFENLPSRQKAWDDARGALIAAVAAYAKIQGVA